MGERATGCRTTNLSESAVIIRLGYCRPTDGNSK